MSDFRRVTVSDLGDWTERALCCTYDTPHWWDADASEGEHIAAARVCGHCPVAAECDAAARADGSLVGVWGGRLFGYTPDWRRKLARTGRPLVGAR